MSDTFDGFFRDYSIITWVRNPIERTVSNYFYFKRNPDSSNPSSNALHENSLSLEEFSALPFIQNKQTRFFSGKGVKDFTFVGVVEFWSTSLNLLEQKVGLKATASIFRNVNPDKTLQSQYPIDNKAKKTIIDNNMEDFELFNCALDKIGCYREYYKR